MSAERSRVFLIFGVAAVIAGGAGFWFFKVYSPAQTKKAAQAEITRWEERFTGVRTCLLGPNPGSSKTSEALAIREMNPDPWDRGHCAPLISKLNRGDEDDTGLKAVEAAWVELDHAAGKAASAFAMHIASSTTLQQDPLPAALDGLDAARAALRAAAAMPAPEQTGKPLPAAKLVRVDDGDAPLTELTVQTKPSAHGLVAFGRSKEREVQIALRTGTTPIVSAAAGVLRAVPDPTWGATVNGDFVKIGAIDDKGALTTPTAQKLTGPQIDAIIGTATAGEVVYDNDKQLVIARTAASFATTLDPPIASAGAQTAIDVDGRAAIVWRDDKQAHGQILRTMNATDEPAVDLGDNPTGATCLTTDRAWVSTGTGIVAFGGGKPMVMRANPFYVLLGCTNDAVLLRSLDSAKPFLICTDDCRTVTLPTGAPQLAATTTVGGKLLAIASHGGVLGVWREGTAPVFYGLPELADPVMAQDWPAMAMTNGEVIDVLARGAKGFIVIRIPAK